MNNKRIQTINLAGDPLNQPIAGGLYDPLGDGQMYLQIKDGTRVTQLPLTGIQRRQDTIDISSHNDIWHTHKMAGVVYLTCVGTIDHTNFKHLESLCKRAGKGSEIVEVVYGDHRAEGSVQQVNWKTMNSDRVEFEATLVDINFHGRELDFEEVLNRAIRREEDAIRNERK